MRNNEAVHAETSLRSNAKRRNVRIAILRFLEEKAGGKVRINEIAEKTGVKKGSVYAVISDLRKAGLLPKAERVQPVPPDFRAEDALEALRFIQRKRDEKRFFSRKE